VWDRSPPFPQLLEERDGCGALIRRYESDGAAVTQVVEADGTRRLLLTDALGSPRLVVLAGGLEVGRPTYDAYGRVTGGGLIGFPNGLADPLTGLLFLRSRWYSSEAARFLTRDSAAPTQTNPESVNRYAYVQGDPVNRTDPSGQEPGTIAAVVTAIVLSFAIPATAFVVGGVVAWYRGAGMFSSYRQMSENLTTYRTGYAVGATFKGGLFGWKGCGSISSGRSASSRSSAGAWGTRSVCRSTGPPCTTRLGRNCTRAFSGPTTGASPT
jgi:RHS repeat-associated protein